MIKSERLRKVIGLKIPAVFVAAIILMGVPHMLSVWKQDRLVEYYRTTDIKNLFDMQEFRATDAVINDHPVAFARVVMRKELQFDMGAYTVTLLHYGNASGAILVKSGEPVGTVISRDRSVVGIDYNLVDWNLPLILNLSRRDPCMFYWEQSYRLLLPYNVTRDFTIQSNSFCIAKEEAIKTDLPPIPLPDSGTGSVNDNPPMQ